MQIGLTSISVKNLAHIDKAEFMERFGSLLGAKKEIAWLEFKEKAKPFKKDAPPKQKPDQTQKVFKKKSKRKKKN